MTVTAEKFTRQQLLSVQPWSPTLFSLRCTRDPGFRFRPGQFARLGVRKASGSIIWRAYSMVSAPHDEFLEFFSIVVPGGEFTSELSRLQRQPGPSFSLVSQALERVPAIKLESIEWKNQGSYAPGQKDENREVTIVRGAITLSQTEPRKVLGLFDNFVEALHGQPGISITVQQRPFDIEVTALPNAVFTIVATICNDRFFLQGFREFGEGFREYIEGLN